MISGAQIRAARGLLGISSAQLAESAGLTRKGVEDIERGATTPREATLNNIIRALQEEGIEFTDNDGVKRRNEGVQTFRGVDGFHSFIQSSTIIYPITAVKFASAGSMRLYLGNIKKIKETTW